MRFRRRHAAKSSQDEQANAAPAPAKATAPPATQTPRATAPSATTAAKPAAPDGGALQAAEARGRREMSERITAVFASHEVQGREAAAAELLAADLPANRILAMLAKMPKTEAGNAMLNRLAMQASSVTLAPGSESQPSAQAAQAIWGGVLKGMRPAAT